MIYERKSQQNITGSCNNNKNQRKFVQKFRSILQPNNKISVTLSRRVNTFHFSNFLRCLRKTTAIIVQFFIRVVTVFLTHRYPAHFQDKTTKNTKLFFKRLIRNIIKKIYMVAFFYIFDIR